MDKTVDKDEPVNLANDGVALVSIDAAVVGAVAVTTRPSTDVNSTAEAWESTVVPATVIIFDRETVPPAVAKAVALLMVTDSIKNPFVDAEVAVLSATPPASTAAEPSHAARRIAEGVDITLVHKLELLTVDSIVKPDPKTTAFAVAPDDTKLAFVIEMLPVRPAATIGPANLT